MGSDKIFMFDNPAAGESAGIMSMIPALLQNKGLDPNLVAALMNGNRNQDAWGGAGCYWTEESDSVRKNFIAVAFLKMIS